MSADTPQDLAPATERIPGDPIDVELAAALPPTVAEAHDPYLALRSPNYRLFASGFLLSSMGLQMLAMAIGWEVYERTGDPLALGLIGLVRAFPVILLALPAGHVVDLYSRKWVLASTQTAFGLLAAALAVASRNEAPIGVFYLLLGLMACARAFNGSSRSALLPSIVPAEAFHNAVTWNSGVFHFSAAVGPIVAGFVIGRLGGAWAVYALTAAACLIFAASSVFIRPRPMPRRNGPARFTLSGMVAGAGHLWREKTILAAITLDLMAVLLGGATSLLPVYAKDILHVGPVGLGWLRSAPYIGAVGMALWMAHRPAFRRGGMALLWSVAGFGIATVVFGLSQWLPLSLAALVAAGALDNISVVIRQVLVQVRTPDELRGRVAAVNSIFIESSNELGAFESGAVARLLGPVFSVVSGGIGTILVVLAIAAAWPQLRRMGRADEPSTG